MKKKMMFPSASLNKKKGSQFFPGVRVKNKKPTTYQPRKGKIFWITRYRSKIVETTQYKSWIGPWKNAIHLSNPLAA